MKDKKENKLNSLKEAKIKMQMHKWFVSKYSEKYHSDIIVFHPFRFRKNLAQPTEISLTRNF